MILFNAGGNFQNKRCFKSTAIVKPNNKQPPWPNASFGIFITVRSKLKGGFIDFFGVRFCGTPQNCQAFWDFSVSAYPPEELKELFGGTARLVGRVLAAPGVEWEIDENDDL